MVEVRGFGLIAIRTRVRTQEDQWHSKSTRNSRCRSNPRSVMQIHQQMISPFLSSILVQGLVLPSALHAERKAEKFSTTSATAMYFDTRECNRIEGLSRSARQTTDNRTGAASYQPFESTQRQRALIQSVDSVSVRLKVVVCAVRAACGVEAEEVAHVSQQPPLALQVYFMHGCER